MIAVYCKFNALSNLSLKIPLTENYNQTRETMRKFAIFAIFMLAATAMAQKNSCMSDCEVRLRKQGETIDAVS